MNNIQHQQMVQKAVKAKFHGHRRLNCKTTPQYPDSAEREFKRVTNGYVRVLNKALKENLPDVMDAYRNVSRTDARYDGLRDFERILKQIFMKIASEIEQRLSTYDLEDRVRRISKMVKNMTYREWKRAIRKTFGIDLMDDYYSGDFYASALQRWTDENVLKIKSIPTNTLNQMQQIILDGYKNGSSITSVAKQIQEEYGVTRKKAQLLARDQVATLNSQITKMQQEDAGCKHYRWSDSRDSRVRDCHKSLNGQIFSWDDPPAMWYMTKSRGIVYTGRRCHPGEDYCCRCIAIPVFDIDTIDIPIKDTDSKTTA